MKGGLSMAFRMVCTGRIIKDYLEARDVTQKQLHIRTGISERHISKVLHGHARLTEEFALKLEKVISGVPASYWLNYEAKYREQVARDEEAKEIGKWDLKSLKKRFYFQRFFKD